jgi:hypothetical protein
MLFKGILIGGAVSVVLLWVFLQLNRARIPFPGPVSYDIYSLRSQAISFFGGVGIGFMATVIVVVGGVYAVWRYAQLHAGT